MTTTPALLALDWGTSSLRAFLLDGAANVLESRHGTAGIQNLPEPGEAGFRAAFAAIAGDWLAVHPALPVVAGGMVGSAQGWREAGYVACPAGLDRLAAQGVWVDCGPQPGRRMLIAPGLIHRPADGAPDVMRGEEIQLLGALAAHPDWATRACMVLPGTHSKWVEIRDGRVERFATYMTGELFAVLARHSILGRLMPEQAATPEAAAAAFAQGVAAARTAAPGDLGHQLFAVRTLGLTGRLAPATLRDYLSGLLIGHELVSGLAARRPEAAMPLVLIGDPALCRHYAVALDLAGVADACLLDNPAPTGLFRFAQLAGLLPPAPEMPHA